MRLTRLGKCEFCGQRYRYSRNLAKHRHRVHWSEPVVQEEKEEAARLKALWAPGLRKAIEQAFYR